MKNEQWLTGMVYMLILRRVSRTLDPHWPVHRGQWRPVGQGWELLTEVSSHGAVSEAISDSKFCPALACKLCSFLENGLDIGLPRVSSAARTAPFLLSGVRLRAGAKLITVGLSLGWVPLMGNSIWALLWSAAWELKMKAFIFSLYKSVTRSNVCCTVHTMEWYQSRYNEVAGGPKEPPNWGQFVVACLVFHRGN